MATSWLGVGDRAHLYARRWWLLALFARLPRDSVRKLLSTGQPPHHKASHRYIDERFARRAQPLVVLGHPPVVGDPREGALHHPPTRQDPKTPRRHEPLPVHLLALLSPLFRPDLGYLLGDRLCWRLAHNLDAHAQDFRGPPSTPSSVSGIDP